MSTRRGYLFGLAIFVAGGLAGLIASGAFASFVQYTNTLEFCIGCHEMESTVYEEYKKTPHYRSPSGVRPECSSCHVPHGNWLLTVWFKVKATEELYHNIVGTVDTPEKFEAKRLELAENVWAYMKATDSRECRGCHKMDAMDLDKQKPRAKGQHETAEVDGKTCIDCHKGIAHKPVHKEAEEPQEPEGEQKFTL